MRVLDPLPDLAIGCSGGPDSLALALLAAEWAGARGGRALALVVDHGLRPESRAEAEGVVAQLARRGIPARLLPLALPPGPRQQERAREARRAALLAACAEEGLAQLLLAHHAGDQAETVLFRALRGSGARGLAGMAPLAPAAEALLLRPLLGVPPARLVATCAARGAAPLRDPSNADPRFARARLRAQVPAALAAAGALPAARRFAARRSRRGAEVAARLARAARLFPEGCARLDLAALGADEVAREALAALLRAVGGGGAYAAPAEAAAALLARGRGTLGGAALLPGGRWLVRESAGLAPALPARDGAEWDGRFRLRGAVPAGLSLGALGAEGARRLRGHAAGLPAAALPGLPALWEEAGRLALVPQLRWPSAEACATFRLEFRPASGPASEMPVTPITGVGVPHYLRKVPGLPRREDHAT